MMRVCVTRFLRHSLIHMHLESTGSGMRSTVPVQPLGFQRAAATRHAGRGARSEGAASLGAAAGGRARPVGS